MTYEALNPCLLSIIFFTSSSLFFCAQDRFLISSSTESQSFVISPAHALTDQIHPTVQQSLATDSSTEVQKDGRVWEMQTTTKVQK